MITRLNLGGIGPKMTLFQQIRLELIGAAHQKQTPPRLSELLCLIEFYAVNSGRRRRPDPPDIIPDYRQSHIFYHLPSASRRSPPLGLTNPFFLVSGIETEQNVRKLNIMRRHLPSLLTGEVTATLPIVQLLCRSCLFPPSDAIYYVNTVCSIHIGGTSAVNSPPPY